MDTQDESVITIDNYSSRMSTYDASDSKRALYALVDMGSNGIRFSISDLSPPRSRLLPCLYRERAGISLYDALHETSADSKPFYFSEETVSKVAKVLGRFKSICEGYDVPDENIQVFATEAMRTAKNRQEMLDAIKAESGLAVDILSPPMESLFGAMGARSGYNHVDGLFMDLGGGSVQMTYVNSKVEADYDVLAAEAANSMPFGAAKLTQALNSVSAQSTKDDLRQRMQLTFTNLTKRFPRLAQQANSPEGIHIYFCGGGFRGYGSMLMHTDPIQPYPISSIGGYTVPGNRFIKWREMLHANNYEEGKIFGMSKRRREQFPAIVAVVQALIEAVPKIREVTFCSGGNREGVLFMKLPRQIRESHPVPLFPSGSLKQDPETLDGVTELILSALPENAPSTISKEILHYVARNIWQDQGESEDTTSARAIHAPTSGALAGLPGINHETRGILSLILCARWGSDLGAADTKVRDNLRDLLGHQLSWWCDYIGTISRLLGTIIPVCPPNRDRLQTTVQFAAKTSHGLGKKGHKVGIKLDIKVNRAVRRGVSSSALEDLFSKVGKGTHQGWKVDAEVDDL